ncbi:MAG: hypothetical protein R6W06_07450 [Prochlorococcaceae cyanobacterium]
MSIHYGGFASAYGHSQGGSMYQRDDSLDAMETYFECITTCSLDDGECVTACVERLRESS